VGGLLLGSEELVQRVRMWEQETNRALDERQQAIQQSQAPQDSSYVPDPKRALPAPADTPAERARYAVIGALFEAQYRLSPENAQHGPFNQAFSKLVSPMVETLRTNWLLAPARQQFDRLVSRGETEMERWIETGRIEEQHSRIMAQIALEHGTNTVVSAVSNAVSENPEIRDLVQQQGAGLADEVVEEVREWNVSADTFLENLVRLLLRRAPREELPAPPEEVREHAANLRPNANAHESDTHEG
jgi:hypothetical protein